VPIGRSSGGQIFFDPFDAYEAGSIRNPNVVVSGAMGQGKSTVIKMLAARSLDRGRAVTILDPKGEYAPLAHLYDGALIRPGESAWWPISLGLRGRNALSLVRTSLGRALTSEERHLVSLWTEDVGHDSRPLRELAHIARHHATREHRDLVHAIETWVTGDLGGIFDGDGPPCNTTSHLTVFDLSAYWHSEILGSLSVGFASRPSMKKQSLFICDEAWLMTTDESFATWLRGSWKMSRANGVSHVIATHHFNDFDSVIAQNSGVRHLLRESDVHIMFGMTVHDANHAQQTLGLSTAEVQLLPTLGRGQALFRLGTWRSVAHVIPLEEERGFIDSDQLMREEKPAVEPPKTWG
jgi:type IV secretory pathway VirB4 component